jgi:hypothetical protein
VVWTCKADTDRGGCILPTRHTSSEFLVSSSRQGWLQCACHNSLEGIAHCQSLLSSVAQIHVLTLAPACNGSAVGLWGVLVVIYLWYATRQRGTMIFSPISLHAPYMAQLGGQPQEASCSLASV